MSEEVKDRETLYKLIISQLRYDGLDLVASSLSKCVGLEEVALAPSSRLLEIMKMGLQEEKEGREPEHRVVPGLTPLVQPEAVGLETNVKLGLDLEYERDGLNIWLNGTSPMQTNLKGSDKSLSRLSSGLLANLDLLSNVSLSNKINPDMQLETNDMHSPPFTEESDHKLDFLCNLDLIPTPLLKDCPIATRRWLKTSANVTNTFAECSNGINNFELESTNQIQFDQLKHHSLVDTCKTQTKPKLTSNLHDIIEIQDSKTNENQKSLFSPVFTRSSYIDDSTNISANRVASFSPTKIIASNGVACFSPTKTIGPTCYPPPHMSQPQSSSNIKNNKITDTQSELLQYSNHSTTSAFTSNKSLLDGKSSLLPTAKCYRTTSIDHDQCINLRQQVNDEIMEQDINQTIFAQCSIGKTQGYFSDILKCSSNPLLLHSPTHSRILSNVLKIKQFLQIPLVERQQKYKQMLKNLKEKNRIKKKQQVRSVISQDAKDKMIAAFKQNNKTITAIDIQNLAEQLQLNAQSIHTFYKNMKRRNKNI